MTAKIKSRTSHRKVVDTLNFECLHCKPSCCSKKYIALTDADLKRIHENVEGNILDHIMFKEDMPKAPMVHGSDRSGSLVLRKHRVSGKCTFLRKSMCSIWRFRPLPCRLYPLNPIITIKDAVVKLQVTIDNKDCPGVGRGPEMDMKEQNELICQWAKERYKYDKVVAQWNKQEDRDLGAFLRRCLE